MSEKEKLENEENLKKASKLNKEAINLYINNKFIKSKELLEKAIQYYPNDVKFWYNIAIVFIDLKEYENAYLALKRALEINPNDEPVQKKIQKIAKKYHKEMTNGPRKTKSLIFEKGLQDQKESYSVFISYATEDLKNYNVSEIAEILEEKREISKVFYWDRDCDSSQSIIQYMEKSITKSDVVIVVSSHHSTNSVPVNQEIDMAVYLGKIIIPIFKNIDDVRLSLRPKRGVKFNDKEFKKGMEELMSIIVGN